MSELEEFIKTDQYNIEESKRVLKQLHSKSMDAIEECASHLQNIADIFGQKYLYDKYEEVFKQWVDEFKIPYEEAFNLLKNSEIFDINSTKKDSTTDAKNALLGIYSTLSRVYLMQRMRRDFFLGMTEILRLRYSTATSYYRLQSESYALVKLFGDEQIIAQEWHNATSEELGRSFYKKYHFSKINPIISSSDLKNDYQNASSISMHSRIFGVASGLIVGEKMKEVGKPRQAIFSYREIDDPYTLLLYFTGFLKFHEKLLLNLKNNIQEFEPSDLQKIDFKNYSDLISEFSNILKQMKQKK